MIVGLLVLCLGGVSFVAYAQWRYLKSLPQQPDLRDLHSSLKRQEKSLGGISRQIQKEHSVSATKLSRQLSQDFARFESSVSTKLNNLVDLQQGQVRAFTEELIEFSSDRKQEFKTLRRDGQINLQNLQQAIRNHALEEQNRVQQLCLEVKASHNASEVKEKLQTLTARVEEMRHLNSRVQMLQFHLEKAAQDELKNAN